MIIHRRRPDGWMYLVDKWLATATAFIALAAASLMGDAGGKRLLRENQAHVRTERGQDAPRSSLAGLGPIESRRVVFVIDTHDGLQVAAAGRDRQTVSWPELHELLSHLDPARDVVWLEVSATVPFSQFARFRWAVGQRGLPIVYNFSELLASKHEGG